MVERDVRQDDRAVSIPLTHALTFGMTAILVTALLATAGGFLDSQEQTVGENHLSDVGSDVVSHINSLDRLNETGEDVSVSVSPNYPERVIGDTYTVRIDEHTRGEGYAVHIESELRHGTLEYPVQNDTTLDTDARFQSTRPVLCLRDGEITMGAECR